ncbi:MAG: BolA family protein [Steroidobacteraceae bacterium]
MSANIEQLRARLGAALAPCEVRIRDDSAAHAGHAHAGESSHLTVRVVAARFRGLKPLERHRLVYAAAGDLLAGPLHALQIHTETPEEAAARPS